MVDCISLALVMRVCAPVTERVAHLRDVEHERSDINVPVILRLHATMKGLDNACSLSVELARRGQLPESLKAQSLAEQHAEWVLSMLKADEAFFAFLLADLDWEQVDTTLRDLRWYMEEDYRTVASGHGNVDAFRELMTLVCREMERRLFR